MTFQHLLYLRKTLDIHHLLVIINFISNNIYLIAEAILNFLQFLILLDKVIYLGLNPILYRIIEQFHGYATRFHAVRATLMWRARLSPVVSNASLFAKLGRALRLPGQHVGRAWPHAHLHTLHLLLRALFHDESPRLAAHVHLARQL